MKDTVVAGNKWEFDGEVTDAFDDMLERSIPQYDLMRELCFKLGSDFTRGDSDVVDVGCSRGGAMARFADGRPGMETPGRIIGLEVSEPMTEAAERRFIGNEITQIRKHDLREGIPEDLDPSLILSVLTVQFTPIEYRQKIVSEMYERLKPGGALILVEKVLGATSKLDALMVENYYRQKREHGYTEEQIQRKRLSLEGVLVPVTAKWNEELLRDAGFSKIDCFWRYLNFSGWIAVK